MSRRSAVLEWPVLVQLDAATGGFSFESNCECGSGWTVEGKSAGRDAKPGVCRSVSQVVSCSVCGVQAVLEVTMTVTARDKRRRP